MRSIKATARQAGILYLLFLFLAPLNLIYFPGVFMVRGDAAATARAITDATFYYRLWIVSSLATDILFIFLAWTLYNLFRKVDDRLPILMLILVAVVVALHLANLLNLMAPLVLLSGAEFLSAFGSNQLEALALAFLRLRSQGMLVAMAFWGLWLVPFGLLVIRSKFFPRILGILLIIGCPAYLAVSFASLLVPAQSRLVNQVATPFYAVGELAIIIWLVTVGARVPAVVATDSQLPVSNGFGV